ncbi:hypothetical protein ACFWDG_12410 [Peribacillus sp. NPDC060186]
MPIQILYVIINEKSYIPYFRKIGLVQLSGSIHIGVDILMNFIDILLDTYTKGEFQQDVTVNELVEDLKEKLSDIIEEHDRI